MEQVHRTQNASKYATEDVFSRLPKNVISHIMDCLPIKDAVRTGLQGQINCNERTISNVLLHLKGNVTKFFLHIPSYKRLDVEDVSLWVMFLSRRGIKEFTLINDHMTPLKLPSHLFSCKDLKLLKLDNCCFRMEPTYSGFPDLLKLHFSLVRFESGNIGEFINWCPLLVDLIIWYDNAMGKVKLIDITKLQNLRLLSFRLSDLENIPIRSSDICRLVSFLPKLQDIDLDFHGNMFLVESGVMEKAPTTFSCLETLMLSYVDFDNSSMLLCALDMISGFPDFKTLTIIVRYKVDVPPPLHVPSEINYNRMRKLQLKNVVLLSCRGSENEVCLVKYLLACSPLLKKITIHAVSSQVFGGENGKLMFATKLPAVTRTSWTDTNPGRRFLGCPKIEGQRYIYFHWLDPPMCQRAILIIPGLLRARNMMEADMMVYLSSSGSVLVYFDGSCSMMM
nr:hypothetical protein [Tanacetum cinerariifolium]